MSTRTVETVITAHRQREGGGFVVRRPFPTAGLQGVDPFLMLDEMGPVDYGPGEAVGAPDHPHRGFETITYILEGEIEHRDSAGHRGVIRPGGVQWMTAGSGVVHSEMPTPALLQDGGRMHGFQIWLNLPRQHKMTAPRYSRPCSG
jgi:quercetin 2,3-dioxygenase